MITTVRHDLLQSLIALSNFYPEMRWGQLVCFVSSIAGEDEPATPGEVDDAVALTAAETHIQDRSMKTGETSRTDANGWESKRFDLVRELESLCQSYPELPLGLLVERLAEFARTNIYDIEDVDLLKATKAAIKDGRLVANSALGEE